MDRAVQLQPSNPETWYELAFFEFYELGDPTAALRDLAPALYLDPQSHPYQSLYISLLPAVTPAAPARAPARRRVKHAAGH